MSISISNQFCNPNGFFSHCEKIKNWNADHPTTRKVIVICSIILLGSLVAACILKAGVLGTLTILPAIGILGGLCDLFLNKPLSSRTLLQLLRPPERSYQPNNTDFEKIVRYLGPQKFKEKLQSESLSERNPMFAYFIICKGLLEIGAADDFFGPLPQLKEYFLEQSQNLLCSQFMEKERRDRGTALIFDKDNISFLLKSKIISDEEVQQLNRMYEMSGYYEKLEKICRCYEQWEPQPTIPIHFVPEPRHQDFLHLKLGPTPEIEQRIAQIREDQRIALELLDAEYAQLRLAN